MLSVNDKEKTIYSRQITLPEVGEAGQEELQEHGVLIVGMGGLGCPVAHYLICLLYTSPSPRDS